MPQPWNSNTARDRREAPAEGGNGFMRLYPAQVEEIVRAVAARVLSPSSGQSPAPRIALTMREAAAAMGLPYNTFRDVVKRDRIPRVNVGTSSKRPRWRFRPIDLETWLAAKNTEEECCGARGCEHPARNTTAPT